MSRLFVVLAAVAAASLGLAAALEATASPATPSHDIPPLEITIGTSDLQEFARVTLESPPHEYAMTNFRDGAFSVSYKQDRLLSFGVRPVSSVTSMLPAQNGGPSAGSSNGGGAALIEEEPAAPRRRERQQHKVGGRARFLSVPSGGRASHEEAVDRNGDMVISSMLEVDEQEGAGLDYEHQSFMRVQHNLTVSKLDDDGVRVGKLDVKKAGVTLGEVPQWTLWRHDDFETSEMHWVDASLTSEGGAKASTSLKQPSKRTVCGDNQDTFMGGYCKFSDVEMTKTYTGMPPHEFVRIKARYHYFDKWTGQYSFMRVGQNLLWTQKHFYCHAIWQEDSCRGINVCGDENYSDKLSQVVDVSIPHTDSTLTLSFGSTLTTDACEASWGFDDVQIYVLH